MTKKALTEKEFNELENMLPKPLLEYIERNLDKPHAELTSYMMGYFQGMKFIIAGIEPHIKRMDEILSR
jgi:hypothetical protein